MLFIRIIESGLNIRIDIIEKLRMIKMLNPYNLRDPQKFVEIMEKYDIKPSELGITRSYKYMLKHGKAKPSIKLCEKLIEVVAARSQLGAAARPLGIQEYKTPYNILYKKDFREGHESYSYSQSILEKMLNDPSLMNEFRTYLHNKLFNKHDANQVYNTIKKHGLAVLYNANHIKLLHESTARRLLRGYAAARDFLELLGYNMKPINEYLKQLRKLIPKREYVKIFEYEDKGSIVQQALHELKRLENSRIWYIVGLTMFFTGLRSTELVYLIKNYGKFKKRVHEGIVILELNFIRKSKKAYITMFPVALKKHIIAIHDRIGENVINNMRDKKGIHVSLFRKAHLCILSDTMEKHEIDLLQGRVSDIIVKHYTKHLTRIAEKYLMAFIKYFYLISRLEG